MADRKDSELTIKGTLVDGDLIPVLDSETAVDEEKNKTVAYSTIKKGVENIFHDGAVKADANGFGIVVNGQMTASQADESEGIPPLVLIQADLEFQMIDFQTTIGTDNPIEVVAAKSLTVTHFIKITLPGGLTRYIEVGTIS